jgi:phage tail sheath protein FI
VGGEAEEWKDNPVRGLEWTVYEANDESTRTLVRGQVEAFLEKPHRQGLFAGPAPETSHFVRCGEDTMTQSDLNQGTLVVEVGVAPRRPAEFVIFRIQRKRP